MRAVLQRVTEARVSVDDRVTGQVGRGLLVFLGVDQNDCLSDVTYIAEKIASLRIFNDDDDKFNLSVEDVGGGILLVSQFTLCGDCRKGRRPSFGQAAQPDHAVPLYEKVIELLRARGLSVETGEFGENMQVSLVNDGPVTLMLDSWKAF